MGAPGGQSPEGVIPKVRKKTVSHPCELATRFEYVIHACSMPKGKFLYLDPILKKTTDAAGLERSRTPMARRLKPNRLTLGGRSIE